MDIFKPINFSLDVDVLELEILKKKIKRDRVQKKIKLLQERIKEANLNDEEILQEFLEEFLEEQKIINGYE